MPQFLTDRCQESSALTLPYCHFDGGGLADAVVELRANFSSGHYRMLIEPAGGLGGTSGMGVGLSRQRTANVSEAIAAQASQASELKRVMPELQHTAYHGPGDCRYRNPRLKLSFGQGRHAARLWAGRCKCLDGTQRLAASLHWSGAATPALRRDAPAQIW
jgi:hypothetical protein